MPQGVGQVREWRLWSCISQNLKFGVQCLQCQMAGAKDQRTCWAVCQMLATYCRAQPLDPAHGHGTSAAFGGGHFPTMLQQGEVTMQAACLWPNLGHLPLSLKRLETADIGHIFRHLAKCWHYAFYIVTPLLFAWAQILKGALILLRVLAIKAVYAALMASVIIAALLHCSKSGKIKSGY